MVMVESTSRSWDNSYPYCWCVAKSPKKSPYVRRGKNIYTLEWCMKGSAACISKDSFNYWIHLSLFLYKVRIAPWTPLAEWNEETINIPHPIALIHIQVHVNRMSKQTCQIRLAQWPNEGLESLRVPSVREASVLFSVSHITIRGNVH